MLAESVITERVIEDGFSFLLLVAALAFLWFHGWHRRPSGKIERMQNQPPGRQNKAA